MTAGIPAVEDRQSLRLYRVKTDHHDYREVYILASDAGDAEIAFKDLAVLEIALVAQAGFDNRPGVPRLLLTDDATEGIRA